MPTPETPVNCPSPHPRGDSAASLPRRTVRAFTPLALCATLLLAAGLAQAGPCTNFSALPDGTALSEDFVQDGFRFRDRAGEFAPVVEVFFDGIGQPVHGMQFDNRGLRVNLPGPAQRVEIKAGPFSAIGLDIRALDANGQLQQRLFIVPDDGYLNTRVLRAKTAPITELRIQGGDNLGVLDTVCIKR